MATLYDALKRIRPQLDWRLLADEDGQPHIHVWPAGVPQPSDSEIADALTAIDAERAAAQAEAESDSAERSQLLAARDTLLAYRDAATVTNAQTVAVVKLMIRIVLRLWRRVESPG